MTPGFPNGQIALTLAVVAALAILLWAEREACFGRQGFPSGRKSRCTKIGPERLSRARRLGPAAQHPYPKVGSATLAFHDIDVSANT